LEGVSEELCSQDKMIIDDIVVALSLTSGIDISNYDGSFLWRSLEKRLMATGCQNLQDYLDLLLTDNLEAKVFSSSLQIIYSEFFRDILAFAQLEKVILPDLLRQKQESGKSEIRIWSAGCAAGQEPWSVAILLDGLICAMNRPVSYRIFASDLSEADLTTARLGIYGVEALQNVRLGHLENSFVRHGRDFAIAPHIREHVEFSQYDLFDASTTCPPSSIFGDFDLVLCRNVLFYYRHDKQLFILDKLHDSLASSGYFMTSRTERLIVESSNLFQGGKPPEKDFFKKLERGKT